MSNKIIKDEERQEQAVNKPVKKPSQARLKQGTGAATTFEWSAKTVLLTIGAICVLLACIGLGAFNGVLASSPEIEEDYLIPSGYATLVYDSEGHEMTKLVTSNANRSYVAMDKIPQYLADAFVATEDERFYDFEDCEEAMLETAQRVTRQR